MADLTPRIVTSKSEGRYEKDTGRYRLMTVVTYKLGDQGPFVAEFEPGTFTDYELRRRMEETASALRAHV